MGLFAPLRHPLFARFFAGQAVSQLGDFVFFIALTWQVIELTGSATALGVASGAYLGAQVLFLLAGGVIVDRFPRRAVIVASDVLQALLAAGVAALALTGTLTYPVLVAFAALFGAAQAFAMPALSAFVPETVPPADLQAANSLYQGTRSISAVAGPAFGAFLIAVLGTGAAFAFNAASFVASAALLASATGRGAAAAATAPAPAARRGSPLSDVREGVRYVARTPWLWITILVFMLVNAAEAGPRNAVLPIFATDDLGAGVDGIGLLLSAQALGSLAGFLLLGHLPPVKRRGRLGYAMNVVTGLAIGLLAVSTTLWHAIALAVVRGVSFAVFGLMWESSIQDQVDPSVRGRVFSLDMLGSFALLPIALPFSGALASAIGARATFAIGGALVLVMGLLGLAYRPASAFTAEERGESAPAPALEAAP